MSSFFNRSVRHRGTAPHELTADYAVINDCPMDCDAGPGTSHAHMRLVLQHRDGVARQWGPMTRMEHVAQRLREATGSSHDEGRGFSLRLPDTATASVYIHPAQSEAGGETTTTAPTRSPVSFFWIDVAGVPTAQDLDVLFALLRVSSRTQRRWRAEAMALRVENASRSSVHSFLEDTSGVWAARSEDNAENNPDELHVFAEEQYVQLQLAAISSNVTARNRDREGFLKNFSMCSFSASWPDRLLAVEPDRLHADVLDVEEKDLVSVSMLCFRDGIVTWRWSPEVEGWAYITATIEQQFVNPPTAQRMMTTFSVFCIILDELCEAFMLNPTVILNEVDAIDALLSLVRQRELDQSDMMRRVLLLRRRLVVHRRLLLSKIDLFEQLNRPIMRALFAFMTSDAGSRNRGFLCDVDTFALDDTHGLRANMHLTSRLGGDPAARIHSYTHPSVASRLRHLFSKLESARVIVSNATILYTSGVAVRNNSNSSKVDYSAVALEYVLLIVFPPTIVASLWGMNCYVPWEDRDSTTPFWVMSGVMAVYILGLLAYPAYCWATGRPDKLVF